MPLPDPRECPGPACLVLTPQGPVELRVDATDELVQVVLERPAEPAVSVAWVGDA